MPPFVNTGMVQQNEQGSRLFERLGVNLTPDVVAAQVWAQVEQPRLHRPISMQFRALWPIAKSAPTSVTRRVLSKLWRR